VWESPEAPDDLAVVLGVREVRLSGRFTIRAVAARAAMTDAGVAWLMGVLERLGARDLAARARRPRGRVLYAGADSRK
jgi:hypothetical protein